MAKDKFLPIETEEQPGADLVSARFSRRSLLLGLSVAGACAACAVAPAQAAVSMLRTGVDPDLVDAESDVVEEVSPRRRVRRRGRKRYGRYYGSRRRRGYYPYYGRRRRRRRVGVGIYF